MDFYDRFSSVFSSLSNTEDCSLPMNNTECEVVFIFRAEACSERSFRVKRIERIYLCNKKSGAIEQMIPEDIIPREIATQLEEETITATVFNDNMIDEEDSYYDAYETYYQSELADDEMPLNKKKELCCRLMDSFNSLVPDSTLRRVYYLLGQEFFDSLENYLV